MRARQAGGGRGAGGEAQRGRCASVGAVSERVGAGQGGVALRAHREAERTTVEPARSSKNANGPFVLPGAATRSDSSTEPRSPSLFHNRSGSTRRPRLRLRSLLSKSQPSVSQCR